MKLFLNISFLWLSTFDIQYIYGVLLKSMGRIHMILPNEYNIKTGRMFNMEKTQIAAVAVCTAMSFVITAVLGRVLIPVFHKLNFGQNIIEDFGPKWHAKKQGTPTLGGLLFIIGLPISVVVTILTFEFSGHSLFSEIDVFKNNEVIKLVAGLVMALCFAAIGFTDDYIKHVKHRNLGLTEIQKTVMQIVIIVGYLTTLAVSKNTAMFIPGFGKLSLDSVPGTIFFFLLGACAIYATVNGANFTDGLDGLCAGVTLPMGAAFAVMAFMYKMTAIGLVGAALLGSLAGYLIWNHYPAKVMMGDTGSMFLGGIVVALAYAVDCPLIIVFVGIVYAIEDLSDVIQIGSIKLRHKKVFKMAPIHHHFELCGWNEKKIDLVFSLVSTLGCAVGVLLMYLSIYKS